MQIMTNISMSEIPQEIRSPAAWFGPDLAARGDWLEYFSDAEIDEIDRAAEPLASAEADIPSIRKEDFPLPSLGPRLRRILDEILNGRGFVLLRRLPVEKWSRRKTATAYFGIGTHLGNACLQNA